MSGAGGRFAAADLADVAIVSAPVAWGERIVYVLSRCDREANKTWSSLWVVPRAGGLARRLTYGNCRDRTVRADPRGRFLLFVSDRAGSDQVYRLEADGGEARALTELPRGRIAGLAISPDGARAVIVFSSAPPEDDALPLAAELAREAVGNKPPSSRAEVAPKACAAARADTPSQPRARVTARLRNREDGRGWFGGHDQLWLIELNSGSARRLTSDRRDWGSPAWLPSGQALVACASREPVELADSDPTRNDLLRIELESGRAEPISKPDGAVMSLAVCPRGAWVAYVLWQPDDDFGHENPVAWLSPVGDFAASSPLGAGEPRPLSAELDRPVMDLVIDDLAGVGRADAPIWSEDGTRVVFTVSDSGAVRLWEHPLDGSTGSFVSDAEHAAGAPAALGDGEIAVTLSSRGSFPEIGVLSKDGVLRAVTSHNAALTERCAPRAPERVTLEHAGIQVFGYWYPPRGIAPGARAPALLYIHGGPCVAYGERLFFEMQWLADLGYGVLCPNPRGSQSYGRGYCSAIRGCWGEPDGVDHLAFVDWLAARPEVDAERIAVLGGSYGGYMTLVLAATSDRFRTAIAERGLYNWASLTGSSDFGHCHARFFDGKWPWEEPERYRAASPIRLVADVQIPTLVIHYEGDLRVGAEQGIQLFNALKLRGVPSALLLFPEEDHGMTRGGRIDRRLERLRQIEAWLRLWLAE